MFDEVAAELLELSDVSIRKMFGHRCLVIGSKGFAIDFEDELVLKLPQEIREEALELEGAHLFDPMIGKPMREWVQIPADHEDQWVLLSKTAMEYVKDLNR